MLIFLVGYAGSGKSSLGRRLARELGVGFIDTDKLIEQSEGATIADIFYYEGEEYFRRAERGVVERLVAEGFSGVVATGGGLATWGDNMSLIGSAGLTVYLRRSPEQILGRLSSYGREKRPMFRGRTDEELLEFMHRQMAEREPYYLKSQLVVECSAISDDEAVRVIAERVKE